MRVDNSVQKPTFALSCWIADRLQSLPCTLSFIASRIEVQNPGFGEYGGPFGPLK